MNKFDISKATTSKATNPAYINKSQLNRLGKGLDNEINLKNRRYKEIKRTKIKENIIKLGLIVISMPVIALIVFLLVSMVIDKQDAFINECSLNNTVEYCKSKLLT